MEETVFDRRALLIDAAAEAERIAAGLRDAVHRQLHRQGAVVGISGGVDSSVVLALAVKAFGADRVAAVMMPERESSPDSVVLAGKVSEHFGVDPLLEDITAALEGAGCYRRRDEAVARIFPGFGPGWKTKITIPGSLLEDNTLNVFQITAVRPDGRILSERIPLQEYRQIVAASNLKQRTRMAVLYYHAELRHYAVIGTGNRNEHGQGFFVKYGDGGVDVQAIAHLFKTQVYQLAAFLGVPEEVCGRTPTTDTYSAGSSQEEFFFRVPFEVLDLVWLGLERGVADEEIGKALGLTAEKVGRVKADIVRKQRTTAYLRQAPLILSMHATSFVKLV